MSDVDTLVIVLSGIISSVIAIVFFNKINQQPITIKYRINNVRWYELYICVYVASIFIMMCADIIYIQCNLVEYMPIGIKGLLCLFVQSGGLIIVVMIITSKIYNFWVNNLRLNYFIERHQWLRKIFFSLVCVSLAILYFLEFVKNKNDNNILGGDYKLISMWVVTTIQIWIGFGMKVNTDEINNCNINQLNTLKCQNIVQEEKRLLIKNVCSMIVILTMMTYLINRLIKYDIIYIYSIILGMGIGVISLTIRAIVFVVKCRITERSSKTKFQKIFEKITDESVQEYFLKCKYQLKKKDGTYCLVICKTEIIIDEQANFTEPFISEIRDAFDKKEFIYCLKEYNEEDIKNNCMRELKEIANKRTKMLREGHDAVYRLFNEREEEIKNMLMVK